MKKIYLLILILSCFICPRHALAVDIAPRISDREIVERLSRLEEGQKRLEARFDDLRSEMNSRFESVDKRFDDLRSEMNSKFESVDKRFNSVDKRFDSVDKRIDLLTWMFGIFITTSIVILGFVIRMQWQMQKNQTRMDTALEIQKGELKFMRELIEKLLPPKGIL